MATKEQLQASALSLFSQYGVKSVSLDDVAHTSGVSKNSIYQHFTNKEELLISLFDQEADKWEQIIRRLINANKNPVSQLIDFYQFRQEMITRLNPTFLLQAAKYYIKVKVLFDDFSRRTDELVLELLSEMKEQDLLQKWVTIEMLARTHKVLFETYVKEIPYRTQKSHEFYKHLIYANVLGILSKKGLDSLS